jgi:large subunit ribosomal protein L6
MSRIGKKPVRVPDGVDVRVNGQSVTVSQGGKTLEHQVAMGVAVEFDAAAKLIHVRRDSDSKSHRALHGLTRALIANMIEGVRNGYERRLLIYGTGYGCDVQNGKLHLNVGFMGRGGKDKPQFVIPIPPGLDVQVEVKAARGETDPARLVVRGPDKQAVGQFCADVRRVRPSEPYKGKGVRYEGEVIRRKQGKAFASGGH